MNKTATRELVQDMLVPYPKVKYLDTTHILDKEYASLTHKLDILRNRDEPGSNVRNLIEEITTIEMVEATRNFKLEEYEIETPVAPAIAERIAGKKLVLAPIMRAGLAMEPAAKRFWPKARTGHIGFYRNEITLDPIEYFFKMPNEVEERAVFILDPMLATGGSINAAINKLKEVGVDSIHVISIFAAPQGVDLLQKNHPDVHIYVGTIDSGLNDKGYIVPGMGDAGDRIFGTL